MALSSLSAAASLNTTAPSFFLSSFPSAPYTLPKRRCSASRSSALVSVSS